MKISLITATFNSEKTIEKTLQSVSNQLYKNIEYIIIDGKSSDGTLHILDNYQQYISKRISEADSGIYNALNKGIRMATGDIIGFLHSDDELYASDTIQKVADEFLRYNPDAVYGNGLLVSKTDQSVVVRNWVSGEYNPLKLSKGWMPMHPSLFIKKAIYDANGLFDESYRISADYDLVLRFLWDHKISVRYLNEYIIRMKLGGASTSIKNVFTKWKEDYQIMLKHGINPYIGITFKKLSKIKQFYKK